MTFSNVLKKVINKKLSPADKKQVVKTLVPLGLHQGSMIELPIVDLALAEMDGAIGKYPAGSQVISAVGQYSLWKKNIYNCYLDQHTFIRLVCDDKNNVLEAKVWAFRSEIIPTSKEEWEFWLGSWKKDDQGNLLRDSKTDLGIKEEYGLIGWPQFQVDNSTPIIYNRSWDNNNQNGIDPVEYIEAIVDTTGLKSNVKHSAMEYNRALSNSEKPISESLLVTVLQLDNEASVNVFIGLTLDHNNLKILVN